MSDSTSSPVGTDPVVPVVAAVIRRDGAYLLGRRPAHKRHGGLWEFPGGKVGPGESIAAAARRELREEMGLVVRRVGRTLFEAADPGSPFVIRFVEVELDGGTPEAYEHDEVGWFDVAALQTMRLAPSDARFVAEGLSLPRPPPPLRCPTADPGPSPGS